MNTDRDKHAAIPFNAVSEYLPNVSERYQILHHAFTYNFKKVVLIVGDNQSEVIQSTIVSFSDSILEDYGKVLKKIKDLSLFWAYDENAEVPDFVKDIASGDITTLNGAESMLSAFYLWKSMMSLPLPLPSLLQIIPIYCAYWNQVKGGSDTTTKLMDACHLFPPRQHTNAQSVAVSRCISIFLVFVHRHIQIFSSKKTTPPMHPLADSAMLPANVPHTMKACWMQRFILKDS